LALHALTLFAPQSLSRSLRDPTIRYGTYSKLLSCYRKKPTHQRLQSIGQCKANLAAQVSALGRLANPCQQACALHTNCKTVFDDGDRAYFAEPIVAKLMEDRKDSQGEAVAVVVYGAGDNQDAKYIKDALSDKGIPADHVSFFACDLVAGQEESVVGIDECGRREGHETGFADFGIVRNSTYVIKRSEPSEPSEPSEASRAKRAERSEPSEAKRSAAIQAKRSEAIQAKRSEAS